jgi:hypothetical protein
MFSFLARQQWVNLIHTVGNSPRNALGQIDWRGLILPNGNPAKIPRMSTL